MLIGTFIIIVLSYVLVSVFAKKNFLIYSIMALTLLWGVILGFKYISSQQFRLSFDLKFKQVSEHKDLSDKRSQVLPLPKPTAFAYRYSENGATYFTILSKYDIIKFFKGIANKESYSEDTNINDGKIRLRFTFKNTPYSVVLDKNFQPKGYYLYVDSKSK